MGREREREEGQAQIVRELFEKLLQYIFGENIFAFFGFQFLTEIREAVLSKEGRETER
jgi:hypothetical protein